MQRYKHRFRNPDHRGTLTNVQRCLRVDDLDEIGDGQHGLSFDMLGLFSFRSLTVSQSIDLWMSYLDRIGVRPDSVTIHPDRRHWERYFHRHHVEVRSHPECTWTVGYCTEFYVGDLEIGNIVNPRGDCIDVGFGLDRLVQLTGGDPPSRSVALIRGVLSIIDSGYRPGNKRQGYVLRRLLRLMVREGIELDHPFWFDEQRRQERSVERYLRLQPRHPDKPPEWWWDTHGIDVDLCRAGRARS